MGKLSKVYRGLMYVLPAVLFFSYYPVISLGGSESMNFELSVPLIWLVVFDVVAVVLMWRKKVLFRGASRRWWLWVLLPVWLTLSVLWSLNFVRGALTVGILWLLYLAVYGMWKLRDMLGVGFREKWWKWFFGAALLACGWCVVQCVMDVVGVSRECTLLCPGCTYRMFGFPHPNGFAIEPQFMGNLLLAPLLVSAYFALKNKKYLVVFAVLAVTLFLTFSRGAIYAFVVAIVFMSAFVVVRYKVHRRQMVKRLGVVWGVIVVAFAFTLNLQGVLAQVSPTKDTYVDGVAKVVNHLSLGVIDIRGGDVMQDREPVSESEIETETVEKPVENFEDDGEEAMFDGYVAESTETRVRLTGAAVTIWRQDLGTALFGVGLGGAGQALYINDLSPAPKEIVQNEYASLLLEVGLVGVLLFGLTVVLVVRVMMKSPASGVLLALVVAYGVTLLFFSGLPNALQIYLMPGVLLVVFAKGKAGKLVLS